MKVNGSVAKVSLLAQNSMKMCPFLFSEKKRIKNRIVMIIAFMDIVLFSLYWILPDGLTMRFHMYVICFVGIQHSIKATVKPKYFLTTQGEP